MANLPLSNIFYRKTRTGIGIISVAIEVALVLVVVGLVYGTIEETANRIKNVAPTSSFKAGLLALLRTEHRGLVRAPGRSAW